jgi:hypothetical protein
MIIPVVQDKTTADAKILVVRSNAWFQILNIAGS